MRFAHKVKVHLYVTCEQPLSGSYGRLGAVGSPSAANWLGNARESMEEVPGPFRERHGLSGAVRYWIDPGGARTYACLSRGASSIEEPEKDDRHARGDAPGKAAGGLHKRGEPSLRGGEGEPGQGTFFRGRRGDTGGRRTLGPGGVSVRPAAAPGGDRSRRRHPRGGVRLRRVEQRGLRARGGRAGARVGEPGDLFARPERAGDDRDPRARLRGTEKGVAPTDGPLREDRLLRPHRARGRERSRFPYDYRGRGGWRLRFEWGEEVDRQRLLLGCGRDLGPDRRRTGGRLPRRGRQPWLPRRGPPPQGIPARRVANAHRAQRLPHPGREPPAEGRGPRLHALDPDPLALRGGMGRPRPGRGLLRNGARLRQGARTIRPAHSFIPARPAEARYDAERDLTLPAALHPRGASQGRGPTRPGDRLDVLDEQRRQSTPSRLHSARRSGGQRHTPRLPGDGAHGRPRRSLLLRGHQRYKHPDRGPVHNRPPRLLSPEERREGRQSPARRRETPVERRSCRKPRTKPPQQSY